MTCRVLRKAASGLFAAVLLHGAATASAKPAGWKIRLGAADVTRAADPVESGDVLMVDAAGLASSLGIAVRVSGRQVTVTDSEGESWQGSAGSSLLTGPRGPVHLALPLRLENRSVYLPLVAVADLAGLVLHLDAEARTALLERPGGAARVPSGWSAFTIAKPATGPGGVAESEPGDAWPLVLPPEHDSLRFGLNLGHVAGADWGAELDATGSWRGIETRLAGLLTLGPAGTELYSGYLGLAQPGSWGFEAGDLFSEIWGSAQGARWLGAEVEGGAVKGRPAVSLYLPAGYGRNETLVLTGGGELTLGGSTTVAGEVSSDGAWLLRGRYRRPRFGLFAYRREAAESGPGTGLSGSVDLPAGIALQGGWSRSGEGDLALEARDLSLRLPLGQGRHLTLESLGADSDRTRIRTAAVDFAAALGKLQLRARWQRRDSEVLLGPGRWTPFGQRDGIASLSYTATPRLRFDLLSVHRFPDRGVAEQWQQLGATWRLLAGTSLQVVAASSSSPFRDPLHVRLEQSLPRGFSLYAEYGRVSAFQSDGASWDEPARLKLTIRKAWDVPTPAGGAVVAGTVQTSSSPVPVGLPVQLGPYRTAVDEHGRFAFRNVPPGRYALDVPRQALPAAFTPAPPQQVEVAARARREVDVPLVPLGQVAGWVYVDRDSNGRRDPGEGLQGAVLHLDGRVTASSLDGAFQFHNVEPGGHRLSVDPARLPPGVNLGIPWRMDVGLPPGAVLDGVELRLVEMRKPVVFQEMKSP